MSLLYFLEWVTKKILRHFYKMALQYSTSYSTIFHLHPPLNISTASQFNVVQVL